MSSANQALDSAQSWRPFQVVESGFEENLEKNDAREYCTKTALQKAECVSTRLGPLRSLIIAADTVVQIGAQILEKPSDEIDGRRMLKELSGKDHWVHTGMAIITPSGHKRTFVSSTKVTFSAIPDEEVDAYVQTGLWYVSREH